MLILNTTVCNYWQPGDLAEVDELVVKALLDYYINKDMLLHMSFSCYEYCAKCFTSDINIVLMQWLWHAK